MNKKIFTPEEANKRLPLIKRIVGDIQIKAERFRSLMAHIQSGEVSKEALIIEAEVEGLLGEIEELGCFYKDWNFQIGLVDFPSIMDGREVLLCWRSDEDKVVWYHDWESGYGGRTPIPDQYLNK